MTEIILTTDERNHIDQISNFELGVIMNNCAEGTVLTLSDAHLGRLYDILVEHGENTVILGVIDKILRRANNKVIKPITINQI